MKKGYIPAILFFSGLWGISEAVLGGALYRFNVPYASVPLSVIGFVILAFAWVYFPKTGVATLIAACAMLYKFLNSPFFACHLLGILIIGGCFDLFFGILKAKSRAVCALAATYLSYALFAVMITYIFRYEHWVDGGLSMVLAHIGISGSIATLACAVLVPLSFRVAERLKSGSAMPFAFRLQWAPGNVSALGIALWVFAIAAHLSGYSLLT